MRAAAALIVLTSIAHATPPPPPPAGPHPRMFLGDVRSELRAQAGEPHGPVKGAIALCDEARTTNEHDHAVYQGSEWAKVLQACLVAWAATDDRAHAATAIRFMTALLDDLDDVGDGKGGDTAARRDDGYAIRNLGPYTALAYDWLYDQLTPAQRAHARARWKAWLDWWATNGYRHDTPGSNYHAGYVLAATLVAIAEGDEDPALWTYVADTLWRDQLSGAFAEGGVLDGGDWPEGWQYGPLAVAELSLGARAMRGAGVAVPNVARWLGALLRHDIYALSPGDRVFAGEDTEAETPNLEPNVLALDAIALGDAAPDDRRWARGELARLGLSDGDFLLYDALAGVGDRPQLPPRAAWPTWYVAAATGTVFARTRWDASAIWFVAKCRNVDLDHRHNDAGNFVLSRGKDDVIVDPSPYGTRSTLTSNAPTVVSPQLPANYKPSQGFWGERTGWDFVTQRRSGVVAARCNYADQYRFQDRPSDVPFALRDFVLVPSENGTAAQLVVIDRARASAMDLRFRTPGALQLAGSAAVATIGGTKLVIDGPGEIAPAPAEKDCFSDDDHKGSCRAARFPVTDDRASVAGPAPASVHVITAIAASAAMPPREPLGGAGWSGVRVGNAVVVWRAPGTAPSAAFAYTAPKGTQVILDAPEQNGTATVSARADGDRCAVTVTAGGDVPARPVVVALDASCNVIADPEAPTAAGLAPRATVAGDPRAARSGCCGASAAPGSSSAITVIVLVGLLRRRRRK